MATSREYIESIILSCQELLELSDCDLYDHKEELASCDEILDDILFCFEDC